MPPVCKKCSDVSAKGIDGNSSLSDTVFTGIFRRILHSSNTIKNVIRAGLCVFFALVLGLTILFRLKGFSFLLDINYNFLRYVPAFLALLVTVGGFILLGPRSGKRKPAREVITVAQIETLLKVDNKITAGRLAKAANTTEEYAKQVLNEMAVDGKLTVSADTHELVYSKNLWSG